MVPLVLRFAAAARAAGLRLSTAELLDCLRHLELVEPLEEFQFKSVLKANFAKSRREQAHFERLYHLFFHELRQDPSIARSPSLEAPMRSALLDLARGAPADASLQALVEFLGGDPGALLEQLARMAADAAGQPGGEPAGAGAAAPRLGWLQRIAQLETRMEELVDSYRGQLGWEERRDLARHFQDRLNAARRLVPGAPAPEEPGPEPQHPHGRLVEDLEEVHFASLTPREVEAMQEAIALLVRRLKDKISRRYAARRRGVLDVKATLRRAAAYQGVPMKLFFRRRPPRKAKIVTLCDVSGSVWSAARFMLTMLYSLQECFSQVRSFIFVAGLAEVTEVIRRYEINRAIDAVLKEARLDYNAATDYGKTLRQFRQKHMDILNRKTTLIIIGDGRCNYTHPEDGILAQMRERSRRLIWLNPESAQFWYTGDSEMRAFEEVCDEVRPCQNLRQLLAFVTSLVL